MWVWRGLRERNIPTLNRIILFLMTLLLMMFHGTQLKAQIVLIIVRRTPTWKLILTCWVKFLLATSTSLWSSLLLSDNRESSLGIASIWKWKFKTSICTRKKSWMSCNQPHHESFEEGGQITILSLQGNCLLCWTFLCTVKFKLKCDGLPKIYNWPAANILFLIHWK